MYEFYHQDRENANLPMVGASTKIRDLKPVSGILEQTPNFLRLSDKSQIPKLRVVFNRSHPFKNQVVSKVAIKEAREAGYRQVGIETASTSRRTKESQVKPLTADTPKGMAEQRELCTWCVWRTFTNRTKRRIDRFNKFIR